MENPPSAATVAAMELQQETERRSKLCRRALWTCLLILFVALSRDWILRFLHEAPFAWPSLNGWR